MKLFLFNHLNFINIWINIQLNRRKFFNNLAKLILKIKKNSNKIQYYRN